MKLFTKLFTFNLLAFLLLISCDKNTGYIKNTGKVFGTTYGIIYKGNTNQDSEINLLFDSINNSLSTYQENSLINRVNNNTTDSLDYYFIEILNKSDIVFKKSNGFFDPTISPLHEIYNVDGFGKNNKIEQSKIDSTLKFIGFNKVKIINNRLEKENKSIRLNFNAIAKGYAVDLVGRLLDRKGIDDYLIEIGGEILTKGKSENLKDWTIGIDLPKEKTFEVYAKINLKNQAIATSGNHRKFRIDSTNGERYVHIINPIEGTAKASNLLSVSVISKDCITADAYATAFMAMGLKGAEVFLTAEKNIKALLIYTEQNGSINKKTSNGFTLL